MERNELMDDLHALAQLARRDEHLPLKMQYTIAAAMKELDSDVTQVLRLEALIRVFKECAGDSTRFIDKQRKEIEDLKKRRDNLWAHLSKSWKQWHDQQRKLNDANFRAKDDRLNAKDATAQAGFFLRQLRKFGLGYSDPGYSGLHPVSRDPKVVSRDTK